MATDTGLRSIGDILNWAHRVIRVSEKIVLTLVIPTATVVLDWSLVFVDVL